MLTRSEVEAEPSCIWNAFVDLLAMPEYENLDPVQCAAQLVFWYDNEVCNGGHLQYFVNRGTEYLTQTTEALGLLQAGCQQQVFREACKLFLGRQRAPIRTLQQFSEAALEGEFLELDSRFYDCVPALEQRLEAHLYQHQSSFVLVE